MKKSRFTLILPILCIWFIISGFSLPDPTSEFYVNDFANVLTSDLKNYICQKSKELCDQTSAQVVAVTVGSLEGASIDDYSLQLGRKWQIGNKDKNNGLLILIAPNEKKMKCEVGPGLEGRLNDAKVGRFIDEYSAKDFKNGDWNAGLGKLYPALVKEVYAEYGKTVPNAEASTFAKNGNAYKMVFILIGVSAIFVIIFLISKRKNSKDNFFIPFLLSMLDIFLSGRGNGGSIGGSGGNSGRNSGGGGSFSGGGASRDY
jgi:uncharacterized protein